MYIDDILISKDISIRELAGKGYKVHHGLRTSRIKTAPQTVLFLKQEFLAEFLFSGNNIWKILLYICPDEEINKSQLPSKDSENLKWEKNTSLLKENIGSPDTKNENGWVYLFPEYNITCRKEPHGKSQYEGGNIIIEFCRSGMRDADPKDTFS